MEIKSWLKKYVWEHKWFWLYMCCMAWAAVMWIYRPLISMEYNAHIVGCEGTRGTTPEMCEELAESFMKKKYGYDIDFYAPNKRIENEVVKEYKERHANDTK